MVAASEVIALRTRSAALAFGGACQLLQFAVKFFDLAAQLVRRDLLQWSHDLSAIWIQPIRWIGLLQGERRRLGGVGRAVCLCGVRMGDGGRA